MLCAGLFGFVSYTDLNRISHVKYLTLGMRPIDDNASLLPI